MSSPLGRRVFKRYSEAFKQKVVSEIESGALTIHQAQKGYQTPETVYQKSRQLLDINQP